MATLESSAEAGCGYDSAAQVAITRVSSMGKPRRNYISHSPRKASTGSTVAARR